MSNVLDYYHSNWDNLWLLDFPAVKSKDKEIRKAISTIDKRKKEIRKSLYQPNEELNNE